MGEPPLEHTVLGPSESEKKREAAVTDAALSDTNSDAKEEEVEEETKKKALADYATLLPRDVVESDEMQKARMTLQEDTRMTELAPAKRTFASEDLQEETVADVSWAFMERKSPEEYTKLVLRAEMATARGNANAAIELAKRAIELDPRQTMAHVALANAQERPGVHLSPPPEQHTPKTPRRFLDVLSSQLTPRR